jgi:hypothetical protein
MQARLVGIHANGQALLRWAPVNFGSWQRGISQGYRLERYTIVSNGSELPSAQILASKLVLVSRLLPQSEQVFEAMSDTSNVAGVAGAAIYEDSVQVVVSTGDELIRAISTSQQNDTRYGLGLFAADASFNVAKAMALGYADNQVAANSVYEYRIQFFGADTTQSTGSWSKRIDTRIAESLPVLPMPAAEVNVKRVLLKWSKAGLDEYYSSYSIERSSDNGQSWQKRNQAPILPPETDQASNPDVLLYADTLDSEAITYQYRIRGHSIFGISASGSSTNAKSTPALLADKPAIEDVMPETGGAMLVKWTFPAVLEPQIKGFKVFRANAVDGNFQAISSLQTPSIRQYSDASPSHTNYYLVKAIDQYDREYASLALLGQPEDKTPPGKVSGLSGKINEAGLATLNWSHNAEEDLHGYRIFQADAATGDFIQVSESLVLGNTHTVQVALNTTAEKVYFKVLAVDFHENTSEFSNSLELQRPDIVPPANPLLAELELVSIGVGIKWAPSVSSDVVSHEVQRRSILSANWKSVAKFSSALNGDQVTIDTTKHDAADCEYRVLATDDAGLSSSSANMKINIPTIKRPLVTELKVESTVVDNNPAIKLVWEYGKEPLLRGFVVYRSEAGGPLRVHQQLDLSTFKPLGEAEKGREFYVWRDTQVKEGSSYQYQIVAKFLDGTASDMSVAVAKGL